MTEIILLVLFGCCWVACLAMSFDSPLLNLLAYIMGIYALWYCTVEFVLI